MFLRFFNCQTFSVAQTDELKLLLLCNQKPQILDKVCIIHIKEALEEKKNTVEACRKKCYCSHIHRENNSGS